MSGRPRILVGVPDRWRRAFFDETTWDRLSHLGAVSVIAEPVAWESVLDRRHNPDILVTGWGTPAIPEYAFDGALSDVQAIIHCGGTVRGLVPFLAYARGIQVTNQAWVNALPVAQYCLAYILLGAKKVGQATRMYHQTHELTTFGDHPWAFQSSVGVDGATVGLVGFGKVAHRLARLLQPFGMDVRVASPYLSATQASELGVTLVTMEEAMACDVVSIHLGDTPDNHGAVSADLLALVKDGATLINTARGIVIDESALIAHLCTGRFDAVLDVTWPEVPVPDSPLWALPNVTLTPHWAGSLGREPLLMGQAAVDNVEQFLLGVPMTGTVDPILAPYLA